MVNLNLNQQERVCNLIKDVNYKFWLGGFIEGEGSLTVSIAKNNKVSHGIVLQPEFNVTQIVSGIETLYAFKAIFNNKGYILKKSGSDKVWVYSLKGTKNLINLVLPFFETYVVCYSSKYKLEVYHNFVEVLNRLNYNKNKTIETSDMIDLIKLVYDLNPDSKGKSRKRTLDETLGIVYSNSKKKPHTILRD